MLIFSITVYMALMLYIGYYAYKRTSDLSDYMLGGRGLGPWVTALSAGASDMSGWLMMGLPGAMFATGLSASWIAIGLTLGAWANWLFVAPRLRAFTELSNTITIPGFLEKRFEDKSGMLRMVSGLVIMLFFTFYVSAGMVSGGVLFQSILGTEYHTGLFIITAVVMAYTLFGGFLAVSWTDFVQGLIMIMALIMVPTVAIFNTGSMGDIFGTIITIDPSLLDVFKGTSLVGIISLFAWGLGYFGQPHIIVRFMAITSVKEIKSARRIGMNWMIFSTIGAMFTGLVGIAYYFKQGVKLEDSETVFIKLGEALFHPIITGFLISAILAAIMSTISSQLLVTSSSLTEDLYKTFINKNASDKQLVFLGRFFVFLVAVIALGLAWTKNDTILGLVGYAWAGFGASFGPVVLLGLYWKRMTKWGALAGMILGAATVVVWPKLPVVSQLYEMVPGFAVSLLAITIVSMITARPSAKIDQTFDSMNQVM